MYTQCVNSVYTVHNSKNCLPKSKNAGKTKKKNKKRELINMDAEPKRAPKEISQSSNKIGILVVDNSFYRDKTKIIIQNNNYIGKVNEYLKDTYLKIIFKNIL